MARAVHVGVTFVTVHANHPQYGMRYPIQDLHNPATTTPPPRTAPAPAPAPAAPAAQPKRRHYVVASSVRPFVRCEFIQKADSKFKTTTTTTTTERRRKIVTGY